MIYLVGGICFIVGIYIGIIGVISRDMVGVLEIDMQDQDHKIYRLDAGNEIDNLHTYKYVVFKVKPNVNLRAKNNLYNEKED